MAIGMESEANYAGSVCMEMQHLSIIRGNEVRVITLLCTKFVETLSNASLRMLVHYFTIGYFKVSPQEPNKKGKIAFVKITLFNPIPTVRFHPFIVHFRHQWHTLKD